MVLNEGRYRRGIGRQAEAHIRAISLDLDDTLWPIGPIMVQAEAALKQWLCAHAPGAMALYSQPEWVQQAHAEATGVAIQPINVIDL